MISIDFNPSPIQNNIGELSGRIKYINSYDDTMFNARLDTRYINDSVIFSELSSIMRQNLLTSFIQSLKDDTNDIIYFHGLYMIMEVKIVRNDNVYFTLISNDYDYDPDSKYNSVFSIKNIAMVIWIFKMMLNALQKN